MPAIPDRWIPYKACGNVIEGTRFICFKVPLRTSIQTHNPQIKEIWDVTTLLQTIPNLGLIVDLTNTKKYYEPQLIKSAGVDHLKLLMPGRILPPENTVTEFMDAVDAFLQNNTDRLIGVHCTHGLNRTGYMVCRYMRDRMDIPASETIKRFELARGYKMERRVYINDLYRSSLDSIGEKEDITTKKDSKSQFVRKRKKRNSETERDNIGSSNNRQKETVDNWRSSDNRQGETKCNWRSANNRQRATENNWRGSNNRQRETEDTWRSWNNRKEESEDNWKSSHDRDTEDGRRSLGDREKRETGETRDSRRSLFEREKKDRKNSRSSCDKIDYSFDY